MTNEQKWEIITYKNNNISITSKTISTIFSSKFKMKISERTIRNLISNQNSVLNNMYDKSPILKANKPLKFPRLDEKLTIWLDKCEIDGVIVNDRILAFKAEKIAKELDLKGFINSTGFINKFKKRHWFKLRKLCGEIRTSEKVDTETFLDEIQEKIKKIYPEPNLQS
ncbi:CENP-B like protein 2 [Dictyocoela muelleri]|nr:CENP-B like protein 2 [Dictyocoela muelleri]